METQQKPKPTPIMILKIFGLSISMGVGFGCAFYAGYNHLPYLVVPIIFLEMACSPDFHLITRYLRGKLFLSDQLNNIRGSFYLGCLMIGLSIASTIIFGLSADGYFQDFFDDIHDDKYANYIALGSSVLAVLWSCVLVYDAKCYWNMWQRVPKQQKIGVQLSAESRCNLRRGRGDVRIRFATYTR